MRKTQYLHHYLGCMVFCLAFYGNAQNNLDDKIMQLPSATILKNSIGFKDTLGNSTNLPMVIIKGKEIGKTLTILAGVHGYEYPPIMAVQALLKEIEPERLMGNLIVIPIANKASFYGRSPFKNPQDEVNLNNAFPGKLDGTVTEQIAYYITQNIIPISDVFLDIHGGDASEDLIPFVCYYNNEALPDATAHAKLLSESSGFTNVVSYPYHLKDNEPAKYAFKQAVQDGKIGISFEAGALGNVQEEAVRLNKNGIYQVLDQLGMYTSQLDLPKKLVKYNNQAYLKVPVTGILYSELRAGDSVSKGQVVGHITNEYGKVLEKIQAPETGTILYKIGTPPVNQGETLMCIGISQE
ncbi:succinylglutamate desuccinylase/aspartoacylase family protein [Muricauda sp. 334s03]|uniref:Succinylglutamate desuccinylase/aspartoacylase family protein n=1 Tax=Flagellimonas yonaguniensis TaxID=3031325 RepID=A0ABT5Y1Z2_9FLAO|nr:succinylglutamate desuccinylase/aspartoacylase family protein [[Muricauda] yonaguniensis]MDF0717466.1 succinylglutamate desuccinylase/aspartoacylase family protein [[Muricauda] yonaguniensis]